MSQPPGKDTRSETPAPRYQPLVIVLVAVCAGIVADRAWGAPVEAWSAVAVAAWVAWAVLRWGRWDRAAGLVLLASVAACGGLWHHVRWNLFEANDLGFYCRPGRQPVGIEAIALGEPERVPAPPFDPMRIVPEFDRSRLEVKVAAVRDGTRWRPASGRARLTVDGHLLGVRAGDRLRVFGQLWAPRRRVNPGDWDSAAYHRADRRLSQVGSGYPECVSVVRRSGILHSRRWLEDARNAGTRLLEARLDRRRAALAATVLLGAREEITHQEEQAFVETGTVHLLAISGLHVGIVAWALLGALRLAMVPARRAVVVVAAAAVLYTMLTHARPPAIRAMILVLTFCAATYLGRPRLTFNALAAAALVVLALSPADLFSTGVHLSFVAVAGLMWLVPRWLHAARDDRALLLAGGRLRVLFGSLWRWISRLALSSLAIWLLTLPLVMARFHLLTPVAPVLNTLLWVPMGLALVSGFGVLVCGWLLPPLGWAFGRCCDGSLELVQWGVESARALPGSHFWVPGPADWWLVGFYGGLGLAAAFPAIRPPRRWCVALLAGWIAAGLLPSMLRGHAGRLDCTFFSVGHGCAALLELPSGQTMLYDAGQLGAPELGARSVAASLWSRGITHLDAVILSHADADHYNLLPHLFERFSVGAVYVSPVMFDSENRAMLALKEAIRGAEVPVREIYAGDRLEGGVGCRIEVVHPPRKGVIGEDNANSLVLEVEYRGRRIFLPGDLEHPGLRDVLAEEPWDCDVLLAPHHGSRRSNPPGLARWCQPEWVVVSGSINSFRPDMAESYHALGATVLHTGDSGAISCCIGPEKLRVEGFCGSR